MRKNRFLGCLLGVGAIVAGPGCGSENNDDVSTRPNVGNRNSAAYERKYHYDGLDEDVVIHKGADGYWCHGSKSGRTNCEVLKRAERAAYFKRWGSMTRYLAQKVDRVTPEKRIKAEVMFDVATPEGLHSANAGVKTQARAQLSTNIRQGAVRWENWVLQNGGRIIYATNKSMPQFTIEAPASTIRRLAHEAGISRIDPKLRGFGKPTDNGMPDAHDFADVDTLNSIPLTGEDVKVGILGYYGGLRLNNEHEAFAQATITEHRSAVTCTSSCPTPNGGNAICINGSCVDKHESQVAGTISAGRSDSAWGAYKAHFYHYNEFDDNEAFTDINNFNTAGCNLALARDAYDWFQENDVTIVNESFGCFYVDEDDGDFHGLDESFSVDGIAQDYYSRMYEIFITKATGNDARYQPDTPACPHTLNSMCVGGTNWDHEMSCIS